MYTKLKQLIAATLSVFLLGTMSPTTAFAADHTSIKPTQNDSILLNTNNSEVGIELYNSEPVTIAKYQTASAWQSGRFYLKSDNSTLGEFKTVGEFTYDGTICNVTNCKNSVWNVADGWQVKNSASEKQVSPTFAKAVGVFELYKEGLLGNKLSSSATILTSRKWGVSNSYKAQKIAEVVRGWINYFKIGSILTATRRLDTVIRYRFRMCIWKHWKNPKTRYKNLVKLGVSKKNAKSAAGFHGYARVCRTETICYAMSNARLKKFGLLSAEEYFCQTRC